jgi:hypothetical protein
VPRIHRKNRTVTANYPGWNRARDLGKETTGGRAEGGCCGLLTTDDEGGKEPTTRGAGGPGWISISVSTHAARARWGPRDDVAAAEGSVGEQGGRRRRRRRTPVVVVVVGGVGDGRGGTGGGWFGPQI